jgi:hypothetical protein
MTTHITSRHGTNLGPFFTLLVLMTSRRENVVRDQLATVDTAPLEIFGERLEVKGQNPRTHHLVLGPFLTLILTLHSGSGGPGGPWPRASVTWGSSPFVVKIRSSG